MRPSHCDALRGWMERSEIGEPLPEGMASHLTECPVCRTDWDALSRLHRTLSADAAQIIPPPNPFHRARMMDDLRAGSRSRRNGLLRGPWRKTALALALGAVPACAWILTSIQPPPQKSAQAMMPLMSSSPMPSSVSQSLASPAASAPKVSHRSQPTIAHRVAKGRIISPSGSLTKIVSSRPSAVVASAQAASAGRLAERKRGVPRRELTQAALQSKALPTPKMVRKNGNNSHVKKPGSPASASFASAADDLEFVNSPLSSAQEPEVEAAVDRLLQKGDDFISVPAPQIATADSPVLKTIVSEAVKGYEDQKQIVDLRLFQKIDLDLPGSDLFTLAQQLTEKSGVRFYVDKEIQDWKLTALMKQQPVRNIMRQIVRLFNLEWRRYGQEGSYRYELAQSLKQRLREEELKRKDQDQMLLNVVDEMEPYLPYKDKSSQEIKALAEDAKQHIQSAGSIEEREAWKEKQRIFSMLSDESNRDVLGLFSQLSPDQLVALRNGQNQAFAFHGDGSDSGLPKEMAEHLLTKFGSSTLKERIDATPLEKLNFKTQLSLDRQRPDQVTLKIDWYVEQKGVGMIGMDEEMVRGKPDRLREPGNRKSHSGLAYNPAFQPRVTVEPSAVPPPSEKVAPQTAGILSNYGTSRTLKEASVKDWITSADFFEALHQKTGRPILADYYTRIYPRHSLEFRNEPLLNALNDAADTLLSDWQDDDGFLRFRRNNYSIERDMDVPNWLLNRWQAARRKQGYSSLDDLSEMAALSEQVLEHQDLRAAVMLKYGLDEWPVVRNAKGELLFYAALSPLQREQARSEDGLLLGTVSEEMRDRCLEAMHFDEPDAKTAETGRFHLHLRPPGRYEWTPVYQEWVKQVFLARILVSETDLQSAIDKGTAYLRSLGLPNVTDNAMEGNLGGPGAGILTLLQVGNRYRYRGSNGTQGTFEAPGTLSEVPPTSNSEKTSPGVDSTNRSEGSTR